MRARFFLVWLMLSGAWVHAQQYHRTYTINLPDSIVNAQPARVDLNNDGLLDVMLLSQVASGRSYLFIVKGDTTITPFLHWQATKLIGTVKSFVVTDYDYDNRLDVVLSTTQGRVAVYLNKGNLTFSENPLSVPAFTQLLIVDLDDDAKPEWILSDEGGDRKLMVFRQSNAFMWTLAHDSLKVAAASLALTDQNIDGRRDLFVSGAAGPDSLVSVVLVNDGKLRFEPTSKFSFAGKTSPADANGDGIFDFTVMGNDRNGPGTRLFRSTVGRHESLDLAIPYLDGTPFVADMNSDGIADYNFQGRRGTDTLNIIQYALNNFDTISSTGYRAHVFGDEDRDGDLDLLVVSKAARLQLVSYKNMTSVNNAPSMPKNAAVMRVFDRIFYYWDPSTDDHTPLPSITYDIFIDGSGAYAGEFDLLNDKRMSVTHGNIGTQNFKLLRKTSGLQFAVQAVDNSFHASKPCVGSSTGCDQVTATRVLLCKDEKKTVEAPHEALWFSFARGYLGKHKTLELSAVSSDTVFYYDPSVKGCDALVVLNVVASNNAIRNSLERYACESQSIRLAVEAGWSSVTWKSFTRGNLGTGNAINVVMSGLDTVTATMTNAAGCKRIDKTTLRPSVPDVTVTPAQVKIAIGAQVALAATGAGRYTWRPATGLSDPNIANPVASPETTTTYVVTGYDSLGCADTAEATITVEHGGFVPNLFTPNEDGKNDEIKIYGLTEAYDFLFTIHNREGSIVYRTTSISEATQKGWDGTRQGSRQPAGVYFWKVKGELISGERLLLNGKDSGSIVLVR
jgi:gliding motility-associated-like protein